MVKKLLMISLLSIMAMTGFCADNLREYKNDMVEAVKVKDKPKMKNIVADALDAGIKPVDLARFCLKLKHSADKVYAFEVMQSWFCRLQNVDFAVAVAKELLPPASDDEIWGWLDGAVVSSFSSDSFDDDWPSEDVSSISEADSDLIVLSLNRDYDNIWDFLDSDVPE